MAKKQNQGRALDEEQAAEALNALTRHAETIQRFASDSPSHVDGAKSLRDSAVHQALQIHDKQIRDLRVGVDLLMATIGRHGRRLEALEAKPDDPQSGECKQEALCRCAILALKRYKESMPPSEAGASNQIGGMLQSLYQHYGIMRLHGVGTEDERKEVPDNGIATDNGSDQP